MNAYVYKRTLKSGSFYWVRLVEVDSNGKKKETWLKNPDTGKPFNTKKEAEALRISLLHTVNSGTYVSKSNLLFGDWLEQYLDTVKLRLKPATFSSYRKNVKNHIQPRLGNIPIQKLTAQHLNKVYGELVAEGKLTKAHGTNAGLSHRTVSYIHTIIGASLREAFNQGIVSRNVATLATPPRAQRNPEAVKHWTPSELKTFLDAIKGHRLEALYTFYAFTGCRRGEALNLSEREIDFEKGTVTFTGTINKIDGKIVQGSTKTTRGHRTIEVDKDILRLLDSQLIKRDSDKKALGDGYKELNLVFANLDGTYLYPERVTRAFSEIVQKLGVPKIPLHGLRHTHASILLASRCSINYVAQRLGDNPATVMNTYAHVLPNEGNLAVENFQATVENAHLNNQVETAFKRTRKV
jgi:integrase